MDQKLCKTCQQPRPIDEFRIYKVKYRVNTCSGCERERAKANRRTRYHTKAGKEIIKAQNQVWRASNPDYAERKRIKQNDRYVTDEIFRERRKFTAKQWRLANKPRRKELGSAWFQKHKARLRDEWNERFRTDPAFRLRNNLRHAIWEALRAGGGHKGGRSILKYLPYTMEELCAHLERLWELWMSWDNYGVLDPKVRTWQIDHIIPQTKLPFHDFSDPNFLACWALENLRPLESSKNLEKGCRAQM